MWLQCPSFVSRGLEYLLLPYPPPLTCHTFWPITKYFVFQTWSKVLVWRSVKQNAKKICPSSPPPDAGQWIGTCNTIPNFPVLFPCLCGLGITANAVSHCVLAGADDRPKRQRTTSGKWNLLFRCVIKHLLAVAKQEEHFSKGRLFNPSWTYNSSQ